MKGGTNGRTNERTNGRTKVPLCSTGLRPLWGRCPKREGKGERDGDGGNEMEGVRGREGRREGGNEGE